MALKKKHESAVADEFIKWYNREAGRNLVRVEADDAPDTRYKDEQGELGVEVTTAWYGKDQAEWTWGHARKNPNTPNEMFQINPDESLAVGIQTAIDKKKLKHYGCECVLVVAVYPHLTTADELAPLLSGIESPDGYPFAGIYVVGDFPASSSGAVAGYRCFPLM